MKNIKYLVSGFLLFLAITKTMAQDDGPIQDTLQICYNTGFELGITSQYSFTAGSSNNVDVNCGFDVSGFSPETPGSSSGNVTLITPPGYDPVLAGLTTPVLVNTVNSGNYSIKLNDNDGTGYSVTTMSKAFNAANEVNTFVTFNYSAIMQTHTLADDNDLTRFRIRIYDSNDTILAEECIDPVNDASLFTNAGNTTGSPIYYTGWRCHTLYYDASNMIENPGRIEFTIIDCGKGDDYSTVYIDDICNKEPCSSDGDGEECTPHLKLHTDVSPGNTDERKRSEWIKAYNTIGSTNPADPPATAIYFAGDEDNEELMGEILLLPGNDEEDPSDTVGFECLKGSVGHFYIADCESADFVARHAMPQTEEPQPKPIGSLQIFPNPTNNELNISSSDIALKAIKLVSFDGKLVLEKQPGADNKNMKLDMSALSSGIYILSVETTDGAVTTHKIVKE